jgi:hypothetical protein
VLENVWKFGFRIAEKIESKTKQNKIFKKNKSSKILAEEFLKSFRKKNFLQRLRTLRRDFQALVINKALF